MDCPQEGPARGGPWSGPRRQDCRAAARRGSGVAVHVHRSGDTGERGRSGERAAIDRESLTCDCTSLVRRESRRASRLRPQVTDGGKQLQRGVLLTGMRNTDLEQFSPGESCTPFVGVTRGMKNRIYDYGRPGILVKYSIRKTPQQTASIIRVDNSTGLWSPANPLERGVD